MSESFATHLLRLGPIGALSARPAFIAVAFAAVTFGFLPHDWVIRWGATALLALLVEVGYRSIPESARADRRLVLDRFTGMWATLIFVPDVLGAIVAAAVLFGAATAKPPPGLDRVAARFGARRVFDDLVVAMIVGPLVLVGFRALH